MGYRFLAVVVSVGIFLSGCAGKRINIDPSNPVYKPKSDFELNYGFFITPDEMKEGYTPEKYPTLKESIKSFNEIDTLEEFSKFEKHFWEIRDFDPRTPQNEFKELIDGRIQYIRNEIFRTDSDIPGTFFGPNGGLKGDMARAYLLRGRPHYAVRAQNMSRVSDLMAWIYFYEGKPLFVFLFYDKGYNYQLFRNYSGIDTPEAYMDRLREIAKIYPTSEDDYALIERELFLNDQERIFWFALAYNRFSYYPDIVIEGGNNKDKFGALDPPEPIVLTAERFKSTILGQPNIPEGTELFESGYRSFLPAYIRNNVGSDHPTFLMIIILRKNVDWMKQDNNEKPYAANLNLRISFQNKKTLQLTEFMTYLRFELSQEEFDKRNDEGELIGSLIILPASLPYFDGEKMGPMLRETLKQLEPGGYVVNIYLQHTLTKKYNALREEIVIK